MFFNREIINLKYTLTGDHSENILSRMIVRRAKRYVSEERPQGHAVPDRLPQNCDSGKSLIHSVCRKFLCSLSAQTAGY